MATGLATRDSTPLPEAVEQVIVHGDLAKLSTQERLKFYLARCQAANLDPRCRPFEYINLNGKLVLYAKKECAEQLNGLHGISHTIIESKIDEKAGLCEVLVQASMGSRTTVDVGIVPIAGLKGADLANAKMKAMTKAKRRATLSLCGLGDVPDETELETVQTRECTETGELKAVDNESGHGRGQFASEVDAQKWLARAEAFLQKRLDRWRDHWASVFDNNIPSDVHDPCNIFQLDAHLVKEAIEIGHLKPGSTDDKGLKRHQLGKLTGILWLHRGKKVQQWMVEECNRYLDEQERLQVLKIEKNHPEVNEEAPETEDQEAATDEDFDGVTDDFPKGAA